VTAGSSPATVRRRVAFRALATRRHRRALISLFVAATFFRVAQLPDDLATMTRHGAGILQLEVVGTTSRAHRYLNEWGPAGRSAARRSLWLDYCFVVCWAALFAALCALVADRSAGTPIKSTRGQDPIAPFGLVPAREQREDFLVAIGR
jgi:hypothetical protein